MSDNIYKAIGLMSGTSLDGVIDVALIETDGQNMVKPVGFYAHPYDRDVRDKVRACFGKVSPDDETREAEALVTDLHIEAVKASGFDADIIGFHGQTITHAPSQRVIGDVGAGFTWQLGDGARMAAALGVDVVHDFRSNDVKDGGQGAPLAPLYHVAMIGERESDVAVLNLGGVGNVTYISGESLIAFDTGPANAMMDDYMAAHLGREFDENGALAKGGSVDSDSLAAFLDHGYFHALPPKSLDRNDFAELMAVLPDDPKDAMATLAAMTVAAVKDGVKYFPQVPEEWYVCGGGRKNMHLMEQLAAALSPARVYAIEEIGFDGDAVEAQAFAYLAVRSLLGLPISMPGTTGVTKPALGGVLHKS